MAIKDILVVVTSSRDRAAIELGAALADRENAHLSCVFLTILPDNVIYADAAVWPTISLEFMTQARAAARDDREALREGIKHLSRDVSIDNVEAFFGAAGQSAVTLSRNYDLTILPTVSDDRSGAVRKIFESVLLGSGRPVLLAPPGWSQRTVGQRVLIGWNASKEAARAVNDALPLIAKDAAITVATIDARPSIFGHGDVPGADIGAHLARHGFDVDVRNLDGLDRAAAQTLADEAGAMEADLIVIGGYGHAKLQEIAFGGATRDLSRAARTPVFLSH